MRGKIKGFGPRLRGMREARHLSRRVLAEAANTNPMSIVNFEGGKRLPTLELAWRIATAMGVSVAELLPAPWHPGVKTIPDQNKK